MIPKRSRGSGAAKANGTLLKTAAGSAPKKTSAIALLSGSEDVPISALRALGFSSHEELVQGVASQHKLPRLELDGVEIDRQLAQLFPQAWAQRHHVVPVFASQGELTVATCDPSRIELFDWMGRELRRQIVPVVASLGEIKRSIVRLYEAGTLKVAAGNAGRQDVLPEALLEATPIVDRLIAGAVEQRASDIHVEATEKGTLARYRVDGVLHEVDSWPGEVHSALVSRIKVMAELDISERQVPQDGRIKIRKPTGDHIDLRVSTLPTYFGEKVCCRILDNFRASFSLTEIGFAGEQLATFERLIRNPYGLVLVTGPAGSGKSTTLYSALNTIRSTELNILSVEDPIEYQLPGINQVQILPKRGLTFATALRAILRQDPDVVLVGEIRDQETGVIAAEAALTGHLVMASLHTNDATSAITRLMEMGIEPQLVAPSLLGVVAQRLMRKVCTDCVELYEAPAVELQTLRVPEIPKGTRFSRGRGCLGCQMTGYRGRVAVREILEISEPLKWEISRGAHQDELWTEAVKHGFRGMRFEALRLLFAGITSSEEVLRLTR